MSAEFSACVLDVLCKIATQSACFPPHLPGFWFLFLNVVFPNFSSLLKSVMRFFKELFPVIITFSSVSFVEYSLNFVLNAIVVLSLPGIPQAPPQSSGKRAIHVKYVTAVWGQCVCWCVYGTVMKCGGGTWGRIWSPLFMNNRSLFISSNCSPLDCTLVAHKHQLIHVTSLSEMFLFSRSHTP